MLLQRLSRDIRSHKPKYAAMAAMIAVLVLRVPVPGAAAKLIDTTAGTVGVYLLAVSAFLHCPMLGIVSLMFAYDIVKRSEQTTGSWDIRRYEPSEEKRNVVINAAQVRGEGDLEVEMVQSMLPYAAYNEPVETSFLPVAAKSHGAAKL
jgi:hypothetical protein